MMNSSTAGRRFFAAVALVAPIFAVQGLRVVFGPSAGPAFSTASATPAAPDPALGASAAAPVLTDAQQRTARWLDSLGRESVVRSPMQPAPALPVVAAPAPRTDAAAPVTPSVPAALHPKAELTLNAVMGSKTTELAMISGRVCRVGTVIEPGWTVTVIDAKTQIVTIQGPEGVKVELRTPETKPAAE
ncbi:hypothetical protein BH11PLA1_BH11PLA1_16850 [soil metagenome]